VKDIVEKRLAARVAYARAKLHGAADRYANNSATKSDNENPHTGELDAAAVKYVREKLAHWFETASIEPIGAIGSGNVLAHLDRLIAAAKSGGQA